MQVTQFEHTCGERVMCLDIAHTLGFAQHRSDLATVFTTEIATYPLTKVGGFANVEHLASRVMKEIHPGRTR